MDNNLLFSDQSKANQSVRKVMFTVNSWFVPVLRKTVVFLLFNAALSVTILHHPYYNTKVFALVSTPFKRFADTFNRAFNTVMCVLMESFPHIRMQSWYKITMVILIITEFFPSKVTDIITNIIWNHWQTCNHTNYTYYTYQHCYDRIKITITHHHTYSTQLSWSH